MSSSRVPFLNQLESYRSFASSRLSAHTLLLGLAAQVPVFATLWFLYLHRPVADPTGINYDVRIFFDAATAVLRGQLPYRDFFFQYPPLALLFFIPPRLIASDLASYFAWFSVELLVLGGCGVLATAAVARRLGQPPGPTLLLYSVGLLALGSIVPQRYDLAPAILVLLALCAWLYNRRGLAWALLAIGTLTKIYPALLLPLFTIAAWRTAGARAVVRGWIIFGIVVLVVMLPLLATAPGETLKAFSGQAGRGLEIESTFASLLLAGRAVGLPAEIVYQKQMNSWDVTAPYAEQVATLALVLQFALLLFAYARFLRERENTNAALVPYASAVIALALLTSKVFSPQYMIWLFPLALLSGKKFVWTSALFLLAALVTQIVFPLLWGLLKQGDSLPILLLIVRDLGLAALCIVCLRPAALGLGAPAVESRIVQAESREAT